MHCCITALLCEAQWIIAVKRESCVAYFQMVSLSDWWITPEITGWQKCGQKTDWLLQVGPWPICRSEVLVSSPEWQWWWPEDQSEGCWSLAGDSLSQLPPGTDRRLRAPSCRLGPENQNRGGIHPSPNKLHSADKPKASWWCWAVSFVKEELEHLAIKKYCATEVFYVQLRNNP